MVNGCQPELDQSSSWATASMEEVGEACNVRVSQARGRMKGQGLLVLCSPDVNQETMQLWSTLTFKVLPLDIYHHQPDSTS